jgi:hypothetical protein
MGTKQTAGTFLAFSLKRGELPELSRTAAKGASISRNRHFRLTRAQLILLAITAIAQFVTRFFGSMIAGWVGILPGDVRLIWFTLSREAVGAALVPGALVVVLAVVYVVILAWRQGDRWRGRRALAEAMGTLAWRYSMEALPGDLPGAKPGARPGRDGFDDEFRVLSAGAQELDLPPPAPASHQITAQMNALRMSASPQEKLDVYVRDRVQDQLDFYLPRAASFRHWRTGLQASILVSYLVLGVGLAPLGGFGVATTIAAALGSWMGTRHYEELGQSYGAMARRLSVLKDRAERLNLNPSGAISPSVVVAQFVDDVETLLEAEHRDWLGRI